MAVGSAYLSAKMLVQLNNNDVHVDWLKFYPSLSLTNKAFRLYYDAYKRASNARGSLSTNMLTDLSNAAHEGVGWGRYSGDLATVFETLWKSNKQWYENYSENYCGPQISGAIQVPVGVNSFLKAVDSRAETLQKNYSSLPQYLREVKAAKSNNRWSEIGSKTETLKTVLEKSEPLLWLYPQFASSHEYLGKWVEGVGTIHSFLENFNKFRYELQTGIVNAALVSGLMHVVSNAVPVFGDVYAKAIEVIPSLVKWAQNIRDEREKLIHQIMGRG